MSNFDAINYFRNLLNDLGEINSSNETQYRAIVKMIEILLDTAYEEGMSYIDGPHNSRIKNKYESDIDYLEINSNPMVKEMNENNTNVFDIEIPSIIPTYIESFKENSRENDNMNEETIDNDEVIEYIPGTNIPKPRNRETYETDLEYVNYLKSHYEKYINLFDDTNHSLDTIEEDKRIILSEPSNFDPISIEENKQHIPISTDENEEEVYNIDEEMILSDPADIFLSEKNEGVMDTIDKDKRMILSEPKDLVPIFTEKEKNRFKITSVFKPVKEWSNKFKTLIWPKVKKTIKKSILPIAVAATIVGGISTGTYQQNHEKDNVETSYQLDDPKIELPSDLGQMITLNDGTPIFERPDFIGKYGVIGENNSLYDNNTLFMVNAVNLIDKNTNERKEFNLVKKNQDEKKIIINQYVEYTVNNDYIIDSFHVTPVDEEGRWKDTNGLGAWLNPNASFINSYNNETERSLS